jgi:hypothetical protein
MRQPSEKFTIAVSGSGRLLGMFVTECLSRFPHATLYDRSRQADLARFKESDVGVSADVSQDFRKQAIRTIANLADPPHIDCSVTFLDLRNIETVSIVSRGFSRRLAYNLDEKATIQQMKTFIDQVLQAVAMTS